MNSRDSVELILNIIGQDGLDKLEKSTAAYKQRLEELHLAFAKGDIDAAEWIKTTAKMQAESDRLQYALDQLKGKKALDGQGILGASYAAQDFISVLSGGGGLGRALGAVSNNVPQLVQALGLGAGLGGVFSVVTALVSAGIPIISGWWDAAGDSEAADKVKKNLEDIKKRIEDVHAEYLKLKNASTDYEKQSAENIKAYLGFDGNAEKIREGVEASLGRKSAEAAMTPEEREEYGRANQDVLSDEAIERRGQAAATAASQSGAPPAAVEAARREAIARARAARSRAGNRRDDLLRGAKRRRAEELVVGMAKGDTAALGEVFKRMDESPDAFRHGEMARHLRELLPAALEGQDREIAESEDEGQRAHQAARKRHEAARERRTEIEAEASFEDERLDSSNRDHAEAKAARKRAEAARKAAARRAAAQARRDAAAAKRAPHEEAAALASELAPHTAEIVGNALGPQAAMMAGQANPAELQAMTREIARNLEAGQFPADAVLNAFREIAEASARNAQANREFYGRLNGMSRMTGRIHRGIEQGPGASGLSR